MQGGHISHFLCFRKSSIFSIFSTISAITSASFCRASLFIYLSFFSIVINQMLNLWEQSF